MNKLSGRQNNGNHPIRMAVRKKNEGKKKAAHKIYGVI